MNATLNPLPFRCAAPTPFLRLALALAALLACSGSASASFNSGGIETFDGTTVDTGTWQLTNPQWISQSNALFMTGAAHPANPMQLTTSRIELGVGGSAQIQVTCTDRSSLSNYSKFVYLALTTNDSGRGFVGFDSYALSAQLDFSTTFPGFSAIYYYGGGNGGGPANLFTTTLNTLYSLRLDRLSDTSVRYSVLNSANTVLYQNLRTLPSDTAPLYIAFGADSVDATFDNLQLWGTVVPEPSTGALLGVAAVAVLWRRIGGPSSTRPKLN